MQLSKKQNLFSRTFAQFLKSTPSFELFEEKDDPRSLYIFTKLQTVKGVFRQF